MPKVVIISLLFLFRFKAQEHPIGQTTCEPKRARRGQPINKLPQLTTEKENRPEDMPDAPKRGADENGNQAQFSALLRGQMYARGVGTQAQNTGKLGAGGDHRN
jgi:hypothetical protein